MADPAALADAYFAAVTAHDPDAVQACFADDAELVNGATTLRGAGAIGDFYRQSLVVEDLKPTPGPYLVDGNRLAVEIDLFVAGGHIHVADFFTFENDKIRKLVIYGLPT
ncbi:MAG: nuclear transport factor 2 family protein [Actinomycetota bacterium]